MNATKETIIQKIKKLITLAGNNPNEHERQRAQEAAQDLLDKHNLDMADCRDKSEIIGITKIPQPARWKISLYVSFSHLYFCNCLIGFKDIFGQKEMGVIGYETNRAALISVVEWCADNIENAATAAGMRSKTERDQFCFGAMATVARRLEEQYNAEQRAAKAAQNLTDREKSNALMVIRQDAKKQNAAYIQSQWGKTSKSTKHTRQRTDAMERGQQAGHGISINKQVAGKTTKFLEQK